MQRGEGPMNMLHLKTPTYRSQVISRRHVMLPSALSHGQHDVIIYLAKQRVPTKQPPGLLWILGVYCTVLAAQLRCEVLNISCLGFALLRWSNHFLSSAATQVTKECSLQTCQQYAFFSAEGGVDGYLLVTFVSWLIIIICSLYVGEVQCCLGIKCSTIK